MIFAKTTKVSSLAAIEPGFSLKNHRLPELPFESGEQATFPANQVALDFAGNGQIRLSNRLQTCLTPCGASFAPGLRTVRWALWGWCCNAAEYWCTIEEPVEARRG